MGEIDMTLTDELHAAAKPIWDAQLRHPFVTGLADGSLEVERFERWVRQDYLYLKEFARLFAWAVAKADTLDAMSWHAAVLNLTLNTEMALHRAYAERFGITTADLEAEDLLAALLPCAWGYVYVARDLAGREQPADERYAEWIAQYASQEFADASEWLKQELNRVADGAPAAKRRRLTELFVLSSRYEWLFWEMCWCGEAWQP
jgi:thiaminase/transcriptional activator TenA